MFHSVKLNSAVSNGCQRKSGFKGATPRRRFTTFTTYYASTTQRSPHHAASRHLYLTCLCHSGVLSVHCVLRRVLRRKPELPQQRGVLHWQLWPNHLRVQYLRPNSHIPHDRRSTSDTGVELAQLWHLLESHIHRPTRRFFLRHFHSHQPQWCPGTLHHLVCRHG